MLVAMWLQNSKTEPKTCLGGVNYILIGSTSIFHNMIMVTNNVAHLGRLENVVIEAKTTLTKKVALQPITFHNLQKILLS